MSAPTNWTTTSSAGSPYEVYIGVWTNWSRGPVFGSTLTLSRNDGNLVIAFAASFIGLVSSRFWHIMCFAMHRCYSTPERRDALHHQRQVLLCNSASPDSGLWSFAQLISAWYSQKQRAFLRMLPVLLASALCLAAFTIAGGFSSRVSTGIDNNVLLRGSNCGYLAALDMANNDEMSTDQLYGVYRLVSQGSQDSMAYAQQCYSGNRTGISSCGLYVVPRLGFSVDTQAPCPFATSICKSNDSNIRLDSGYIDTHVHLGINSPPDQRFLTKTVYHCAPLQTEGYKSDLVTLFPNKTAYYYGTNLWASSNSTFEAPTLFWQYNLTLLSQATAPLHSYLIDKRTSITRSGIPENTASDFIPIPELARTDADIDLYFLQGNGVVSFDPILDPWYRANVAEHVQFQTAASASGKKVVWRPDEAASPLGCTLQYQFCSTSLPEGRRCGPLASQLDAYHGAMELFSTSDTGLSDLIRFDWFWNMQLPPSNMVQALGPQALCSAQTLMNSLQVSLPDNQWQIDVIGWWEASLASFQKAAVEQAAGSRDPELGPLMLSPNHTEQQQACRSQMILSTDYTSFSLFGLCFIFVTGMLIVIASFLIEPILGCLAQRHQYKTYELLEWQTGETLQLQRLGYQGIGIRSWSTRTDSIPLTKSGEMLESLALHQVKQATSDDLKKVEKKSLWRSFFPKTFGLIFTIQARRKAQLLSQNEVPVDTMTTRNRQ